MGEQDDGHVAGHVGDGVEVLEDLRARVDHDRPARPRLPQHPGVGAVQGHHVRVRREHAGGAPAEPPAGPAHPRTRAGHVAAELDEPLGDRQVDPVAVAHDGRLNRGLVAVLGGVEHRARLVVVEELGAGDVRRRQHEHLAGVDQPDGLADRRPEHPVGLGGDVAGDLTRRQLRDEELRVVAPRLEDRCHPRPPQPEQVGAQHQPAARQEVGERRLARLQRDAVGLPVRTGRVGDHLVRRTDRPAAPRTPRTSRAPPRTPAPGPGPRRRPSAPPTRRVRARPSRSRGRSRAGRRRRPGTRTCPAANAMSTCRRSR